MENVFNIPVLLSIIGALVVVTNIIVQVLKNLTWERNAIISFASLVIDESKPVTREQFNRIFKVHQEYESIIESNGMTNGEVDIALSIIKESYEKHMRNHTFVEGARGYPTPK